MVLEFASPCNLTWNPKRGGPPKGVSSSCVFSVGTLILTSLLEDLVGVPCHWEWVGVSNAMSCWPIDTVGTPEDESQAEAMHLYKTLTVVPFF